MNRLSSLAVKGTAGDIHSVLRHYRGLNTAYHVSFLNKLHRILLSEIQFRKRFVFIQLQSLLMSAFKHLFQFAVFSVLGQFSAGDLYNV